MTRRSLPALLLLGAILALADLHHAWGQQPPPAVQGLDKLTPEERAIAERNLEKWQRLTPEERARALENYRQWRSMTPEERDAARQNYRRFRQLTPEQRAVQPVLGLFLLAAVAGLAWTLWKRPHGYLLLTFGFGYWVFVAGMLGFSAYLKSWGTGSSSGWASGSR